MPDRIKVIDVEWGEPLSDVTALQDYDALQALVRVGGRPVASVTVPVTGDIYPASDLQETIRAQQRAALDREAAVATQVGLGAAYDHGLRGGGGLPGMTVAVCTRDHHLELDRCLDSLMHVGYPDIEILVVDNAPHDDQTALLVRQKYPNVRYCRENRPGLNWARNRAVLESASEIVAFTDDDVIVDAGWPLAIASAFAQNQDVAAVTGLVVPAELETEAQIFFERYGGFGSGFDTRRLPPPDRRHAELYPGYMTECGTGANMAFRRAVFDSVGPFDPALDVGTATHGGGDTEMFYRLMKAGYTILYEPSALVRHRHRTEYAQLRRQISGWGSGLAASLARSAAAFPDERRRLFRFAVFWLARQSRRLFSRSLGFPRDLVLAEMGGAARGLMRYRQARWRVSEINRTFGPFEPAGIPLRGSDA